MLISYSLFFYSWPRWVCMTWWFMFPCVFRGICGEIWQPDSIQFNYRWVDFRFLFVFFSFLHEILLTILPMPTWLFFYCISLSSIEFLTMILLQKLQTLSMAGPKPGSSAKTPKAGKYCSFSTVVVCAIASYSLVWHVFNSSSLLTGQAVKRRRWRKRLV